MAICNRGTCQVRIDEILLDAFVLTPLSCTCIFQNVGNDPASDSDDNCCDDCNCWTRAKPIHLLVKGFCVQFSCRVERSSDFLLWFDGEVLIEHDENVLSPIEHDANVLSSSA